MFTSYGDFSNVTAASFLAQEGKQTPVFVRFSTVAGSRGSTDLPRDVRGFATRFYTDEGNFGMCYSLILIYFLLPKWSKCVNVGHFDLISNIPTNNSMPDIVGNNIPVFFLQDAILLSVFKSILIVVVFYMSSRARASWETIRHNSKRSLLIASSRFLQLSCLFQYSTALIGCSPDLIHAVKPMPDREIPQAATAHDTAWDFFSQQPSWYESF